MAIDTMKKGSIEMLTLFLLCEERRIWLSACAENQGAKQRLHYSAGGVFLSASVPLGG